MTEDEAKTKVCPYMRQRNTPAGMCQASGCMMWEPYEYWQTENGSAHSSQVRDSKLVTGGDCGLKSKYLECRGF